MRFAIALLLIALIATSTNASPSAQCSRWSVAVMSDVHIGDGSHPNLVIKLAQGAVDKINQIAQQENIRFVFITGDLVNTGYPTQYKQVVSILSNLVVPWLPVLGNHDVWQYNSTWEEKSPTGDQLFSNTFANRFQQQLYPDVDYFTYTGFTPVQNLEHNNITSYFQNCALRYCGASFFALDWISRAHALSALGYKGAWPGAELHDYAGGTLPWFANELKLLAASTNGNSPASITMLQHHSFRAPLGVPDMIYGFSGQQKSTIRNTLSKYLPVEQYWGVIAGHWHRWFNGTAFDEWPSFHQWETDACKVSGAFSLVQYSGPQIVKITKSYGTASPPFSP